MNEFQSNRAIIQLVEEREKYHDAIRLFNRIFHCLKEKPQLSADEQEWIHSMQSYIEKHAEQNPQA
ncbi:MAG: hypothetical protein EA392_03725 [Cryomorphaceae bacterium]|nr:MAG: hypothetical protein EA392_03725 [Cryomorphaceae bacterium]